MACCPLHREATSWARPAPIKFKPSGAGVRVLALDGGGIRGIVQLEVLHALEECLGGHVPIQAFFDLMVGTGTGGLLAVALSQKDRTVVGCMDMFTAMCDHAFTPRLKGVPVINQIVQAFGSGRKFKTKPLHAALRTAFGDDLDLFGSSDRLRSGARVAVTTSSATGRESILLASYRRCEDILPAYSFERPHEPEMELKVWESIAAALANPLYFRPFTFHGKTYLDGGLRCVNPAFIADRERRLIWPDVGEPDLFLSVGTGQNRITILEKLSNRPKENLPSTMIPKPGQTGEEARRAAKTWRRKSDEILDAELAWQDFRAYAVRERSEAKGRRFIRFNPDLDKEPPTADSKGDLENLQLVVRKRLQTPHRLAALKNVAHRLVASSFYLDMQSKAISDRNEQLIAGVISCRFEDGSEEMCALGRILEDLRRDNFEPFFLIKPQSDSTHDSSRLTITMDIIRGMTDNAVFALPNVYIPLRDESKATALNLFLSSHDGLEPDGFPISGFPRVLLGEAAAANPRRPTRASSENSVSPAMGHKHLKSDADSISLNGPARSIHSEESWQETQAKISPYYSKSGQPKMSLADLIAQHQHHGTSIRNRTNRFWTYIGNNHMQQHPEMYSTDELAKFATSAKVQPSELGSPSLPFADNDETPTMSMSSLALSPSPAAKEHTELAELEAQDKATREMQYQQEVAAYYRPADHPAHRSDPSLHSLQSRPDSQGREPIPSACETLFEEEEETASSYSEHEIHYAKASPLIQVRNRNTLDSFVGLYEKR